MRVPAAALILLLSACAAAGDPASPSYSAGFADGCATASAEGTATPAREPQRDRARYAMDSDYRAGWILEHVLLSRRPLPRSSRGLRRSTDVTASLFASRMAGPGFNPGLARAQRRRFHMRRTCSWPCDLPNGRRPATSMK